MNRRQTTLDYTPEQLQRIEDSLLADYLDEKPVDYEVRVDGLKIVKRTNNPEEFDQVRDHIYPDTQTVEVRMFSGRSVHFEQITLKRRGERKENGAPTLEGLEKRLDERIASAKLEWDNEALQKELDQKKADLAEANGEITKLKGKLAKLEERNNLFQTVREVAPMVLPGLRKKAPALAGPEVVEGEDFQAVDIPQEDLDFVRHIRDKLDKPQQEQLGEIVSAVTDNPALLADLMATIQLKTFD